MVAKRESQAYNTTAERITWISVAGAGGYNIYRSVDAAGAEGSVPYAQAGGGANWYDDTVSAGHTYYYVVTAVGADGEGARSSEIAVTPNSTHYTAPIPATATGGTSKVTLAWTAFA